MDSTRTTPSTLENGEQLPAYSAEDPMQGLPPYAAAAAPFIQPIAGADPPPGVAVEVPSNAEASSRMPAPCLLVLPM
ncbi:unnamed protein product [Peniophora sp. CBMAI 1063]|nr:unnamed protein product [Peniophora sp. CBMAI 1063]